MSSQEAFLARVRRALYHEASPHTSVRQPWRSAVGDVAALQQRLAEQRPVLVKRLQQELQAVSGAVAVLHSPAEVTQYITQLAQARQASLVVRWQSALLERLEIDAALQQQGVTMHTAAVPAQDTPVAEASKTLETRRRELRELLARADLGVSGVDYVIAETGTLVLMALPGQMRGVSLLPPAHVAVATTAQIVATLADYLFLIEAAGGDLQQALSSCVSFVTGPSRTADIELQLVVGVHGPKELHLVLLDEPTP